MYMYMYIHVRVCTDCICVWVFPSVEHYVSMSNVCNTLTFFATPEEGVADPLEEVGGVALGATAGVEVVMVVVLVFGTGSEVGLTRVLIDLGRAFSACFFVECVLGGLGGGVCCFPSFRFLGFFSSASLPSSCCIHRSSSSSLSFSCCCCLFLCKERDRRGEVL